MISNEYALRKIDEWMSGRISSAYTTNDYSRLVDIVSGVIQDSEDEETTPYEKSELEEKLKEQLDPENYSLVYGRIFSDYYAAAEDALNRKKFKERLDKVPEGIRQEYWQPMLEGFAKLKEYVDNVRELAESKFPEDITKEEIDSIFIKSFNGLKGYQDLCKFSYNAALMSYEYFVRKGKISQVEFDFYKRLYGALLPFTLDFNKRVFGDLNQNNN